MTVHHQRQGDWPADEAEPAPPPGNPRPRQAAPIGTLGRAVATDLGKMAIELWPDRVPKWPPALRKQFVTDLAPLRMTRDEAGVVVERVYREWARSKTEWSYRRVYHELVDAIRDAAWRKPPPPREPVVPEHVQAGYPTPRAYLLATPEFVQARYPATGPQALVRGSLARLERAIAAHADESAGWTPPEWLNKHVAALREVAGAINTVNTANEEVVS